MNIAVFEDTQWQNFLPLTLTKATFDIKVGIKSFYEEYRQQIPDVLLTREYLAKVTSERHVESKVNPTSIDADTIFINGLLNPKAINLEKLQMTSNKFAIISYDGRLVVE